MERIDALSSFSHTDSADRIFPVLRTERLRKLARHCAAMAPSQPMRCVIVREETKSTDEPSTTRQLFLESLLKELQITVAHIGHSPVIKIPIDPVHELIALVTYCLIGDSHC